VQAVLTKVLFGTCLSVDVHQQQLDALLALFALCEEQLARGAHRPEVWAYLSDQLARNVKCTLGLEAIGVQVSLARAVELRVVATEDLVRSKHSLPTTALLAQALARWHERSDPGIKLAMSGQLAHWVRQVVLQTVVGEVLQFAVAEVVPVTASVAVGATADPQEEGESDADVPHGAPSPGAGMLLPPAAPRPEPKTQFDQAFDNLYFDLTGGRRQPKALELPQVEVVLRTLLPDLWARCEGPLRRVYFAVGARLALSHVDTVLVFGALRVASPHELARLRTPTRAVLHLLGTYQAFQTVWRARDRYLDAREFLCHVRDQFLPPPDAADDIAMMIESH